MSGRKRRHKFASISSFRGPRVLRLRQRKSQERKKKHLKLMETIVAYLLHTYLKLERAEQEIRRIFARAFWAPKFKLFQLEIVFFLANFWRPKFEPKKAENLKRQMRRKNTINLHNQLNPKQKKKPYT